MPKLIIPHDLLEPLATSRLQHLTKVGIDPKHLVQYSLSMNELGDFRDVKMHLEHDLIEVFPDIPRHALEYQTLLHSCIDCVQETGHELFRIIHSLGAENMSIGKLRFDRFIGDDLVVDIHQ